VFLLLFAAAMSFWFKEWLDGFAILTVLLINAAIGFFMEYKARLSMVALRKLSSIPAKLVRGGRLREVNSDEIVPGDLLFIESGDLIPADGRLIRTRQLVVDESALTGESAPLEKREGILKADIVLADRTNMVYKGTYVSKGNSNIIVCATGMHTELGKIAAMVQSAEQAASPLEKKLEQFSKTLIKITVLLVLMIFIGGLLNRQPLLEMAETAIALAVAAIPEGLPIVATLSLAQGMMKMARYNVIVKKLSSVETLGGTNVICTDKTGTLTQNKMEVVEIITPVGSWQKNREFAGNSDHFDLIKKAAVLCNTANISRERNGVEEVGDPLEIALLRFAISCGENIETTRQLFKKTAEEPFSSDTKLMATLHNGNGETCVFAKGAAEELLVKCSRVMEGDVFVMDDQKCEQWKARAEEQASLGLRIVAVAFRPFEGGDQILSENLIFLGLICMIDPERPEVLSAISDCRSAGIKVVMITGDHPSTAIYIAKQLGLADENEEALIGRDLIAFDQLTGEQKQEWMNARVFARVNPGHKLDLVKVYQEKGYVVGMTGDGVNDAPALKKADIGIAMGQKGTQVAQEVADMVLKDDSFSSVVIAIRQGRVIFDNIRKFVTYLLSCNLSELLVIAIAAVMNPHFQLLPLQILFINLITDVLPALALGVTPGSPGIMLLPPRKSSEPIIDSRRWKQILLYAGVIALASILAVLFNHYNYHKGEPWDAVMCNNILFFTLICCQLLHVLNMNEGNFFRSEVMRNKYVWISIGASLFILFSLIQVDLVKESLNIVAMRVREWTVILIASLASVIVIQGVKRFFLKHRSSNEK
jgi:Ca2+-transporting ATPase